MERTDRLVRDLRRWAEKQAERLGQIQLFGEHYRPGGCAREGR